ncbi:hypothetical protein [Massilia sp. TS11]|uniref:hypothetical protein n=1 Tax=Massilia sp. TS11 TaxID=2908003 RepID=UPI001EDA2E31|nr:hypothetical protein [Massilia sp. TS11]MCG2584141.1 hypothetical protein [Massilia sp. TS11]
MKWLMSIARIVGSSLPFVPTLIQIQTEIDSAAIQKRLRSLEDPISSLHPQIREVSENIYRALVNSDTSRVVFDEEFYSKYGKPLAILESQGYIVGSHAIGAKYVNGISVQDPKYVVYLCALYEDQAKMDALLQMLEDCKQGQWLRGETICAELQLARPVVKAIFLLYEARGLGFCSREVGAVAYVGNA